jgi:hypothetical protein
MQRHLEVSMLIENTKHRFSKLAALGFGAIALGTVALPMAAQAQVYVDLGPVGIGVAPPTPYYYHYRYWGYPGPYYGPYGYYRW